MTGAETWHQGYLICDALHRPDFLLLHRGIVHVAHNRIRTATSARVAATPATAGPAAAATGAASRYRFTARQLDAGVQPAARRQV